MTNSEIRQGHISAWIQEKGFGFITRGSNERDFERYFFHAKQYEGPNQPHPSMTPTQATRGAWRRDLVTTSVTLN
jgi:hypothetical protein